MKASCNEVGKTTRSKPCNYFVADTDRIKPVISSKAFGDFTKMVDGLEGKSLLLLSSMLHFEHKTRAQGYRFGQKVYVKYTGVGDYMSNFMVAYIFSVSKQYARIISADGRCTLTYAANVLKSSKAGSKGIYTVEEFEILREKMLDKNNMVDPRATKLIKAVLRAQEQDELNATKDSQAGRIPTIDTVFKENKIKKRRKGESVSDNEEFIPIASMVDIINNMGSGYIHSDSDEATYVTRKSKTKAKKSRANSDGSISVS